MKEMKMTNYVLVFFVVMGSLFMTTCYYDGEHQNFDWSLQGKWVTYNPDDYYEGELDISYNTITITGYGEKQTPQGGDANQLPFKGFPKGIALKGYSENEMLFIDDGGVLQEDIEGIPYRYSSTISPPDSQRVELLSLNFGGRNEILQKKSK